MANPRGRRTKPLCPVGGQTGLSHLKPLSDLVGGVYVLAEITHKQDREFNMDEPTMEEKLSSLDMLNDERLDSRAIPEPAATVELPRADSLHILLRQALHSKDHALLFDGLNTRYEKEEVGQQLQPALLHAWNIQIATIESDLPTVCKEIQRMDLNTDDS
ncbi:Dip2/Utp12 Family [Musa troglodytarum]|uniref:Dip2/Utp12 Family n=1 Tax=Musa troglodytarum TaxID=320322 RepID=A0A9E7GD42_9LILI|nr:Dip2/Utp12 Family [Musa troglodytarum]